MITKPQPKIVQYQMSSRSGHGEREYFIVAVTDALSGYDNMDSEKVQRVVDQLNAQMNKPRDLL